MSMPSTDNLIALQSPPLRQSRSPLGYPSSRPVSTVDFRGTLASGPDDSAIIEAVQNCLAEVNLDNVTKKQGKSSSILLVWYEYRLNTTDFSCPTVRALVEQRLQTELSGEKRSFLDRQIDAELANM